MRSTIPETGITAHPMLFCVVRARAWTGDDMATKGRRYSGLCVSCPVLLQYSQTVSHKSHAVFW